MRGLKIDDLERFQMIAQPELSHNAEKILYLVTFPEGDDYRTRLEIINRINGEIIWTLEDFEPSSPNWAPFDERILFTSRKGMDKIETGTGLWIMEEGKSPQLVAKISGGVSQPKWGADGKSIFFVSNVGEIETDVKIIDKIPFWSNGEGWTYHRTKYLHKINLETLEISVISSGDRNVQCYALNNDGSKVAYCQSADPLRPSESDLIVYNFQSGDREHILSGFMIESLQWSKDGSEIVIMGHDCSRGYATHVGVHLLNIDEGTLSDLMEELDRECSRRHYYDLRSMHAGNPEPEWDDNYIYFTLSESDRFALLKVDPVTNNIKYELYEDYSIEEYSIQNGVIVYTRVEVDKPAELWVKDDPHRQLTHLNKSLVDEVELQQAEGFKFTQIDGFEVEGWILKPRNFENEKKYPAIVDIHGGPKSKFGDSFMYEHQILSSHGYAVIYLNIRGSGGYSQEFGDIREDWGNWDYEDLLTGVDEALKKYPWIDNECLGVTGLSYGGFMTNWVITHTNLFKTAISQNSISSWTAFFGTSDIGFHFTPEQIGGNPWKNLDTYIDRSPITYADKVETPVLFIHSWEDYRCWIDQSLEFFTALKYLGKETQLAMFMEGPHTFRSVSRLSLRKKRYQLMIDWFDKYLK